MNALSSIVIWGVVAGGLLGAAVHFNASEDTRAKVQRACLRAGLLGSFLMAVPMARLSDKPGMFPAMVTLGLIVAVPLVVGLALLFSGQRRSGV